MRCIIIGAIQDVAVKCCWVLSSCLSYTSETQCELQRQLENVWRKLPSPVHCLLHPVYLMN